jgi:hypothetical protein
MSTLAEAMSISGVVRGYDQKPIHMIKVTVYRDTRVVDHGYTNEAGTYEMSVPTGDPITVCFDTHWSLNNARDWHPSVVANLEATQDLVLDRFLMRVGMGDSETAAIDALAAYQFCATWTAREPNRAYAEYAALRVSQMKFVTEVLSDVQRTLEAHFRHQAHRS